MINKIAIFVLHFLFVFLLILLVCDVLQGDSTVDYQYKDGDITVLNDKYYKVSKSLLEHMKQDILNLENKNITLKYQVKRLQLELDIEQRKLHNYAKGYSKLISDTTKYYENRINELQDANKKLSMSGFWRDIGLWFGGSITTVILYMIVNNSLLITIK